MGDFMIRELFFKLLSPILIIILLFLLEEIICFIVIKKRGKYNEYKECKSKKPFCTYSLYLYHEKRYWIIKLIIIIVAILLVIATNKKPTYYDAMGNSYQKESSVVFYDEKGDDYLIDEESHYFIDDNNVVTNMRYVDDKGNVSSVNENDLYNTDVSGVLYTLNGEVYFDNTNVYWDSSKQMHYFDANQDIVVANYSFIVNIETGDCTIQER